MIKEIFEDYKRILFEKNLADNNDEYIIKQKFINFIQKEIEFHNSNEGKNKTVVIIVKTFIEIIIPFLLSIILVKITKICYVENMSIVQVLIVFFIIAIQVFLYILIWRIIINNTIQIASYKIKEKDRITKIISTIVICEIIIGLILCWIIYNAIYMLV